MTRTGDNQCTFRYFAAAHDLIVDVEYELRAGAAFVSKTLHLSHTSATRDARNLTSASLFADTKLSLLGAEPSKTIVVKSHYGLHDYAAFVRWESAGFGALLTAQNPYLACNSTTNATTVAYSPDLMWRVAKPLVLDSALLGVHTLSGNILAPPADPIDEAEQAAMVAALRQYLVAPGSDTSTVKINIGWTENDYQLDISKASDRATYKRIIDRAAQFGISHILFAPRNSDVSDKRNNTDAWGWEQILWFGMGQKIRQGLWTPGDALPASLIEMLNYFKLRKVKPVAYVYPILAFLAGTGKNGTSPPWIVPGTYDLEHSTGARPPLPLGSEEDALLHGANGPLRACLASPELQDWLPKTMLAFAKATGAGGFSFDYTYFEQHGPFPTFVASQYAQWAGWRTILAALHADPKACAGGTMCVVDNRQQNHAWGPWMWVQGGTYAEPLMSDEQPGSWMFYEADLHTDRLSANRQRQIAWSYRQLEFCPAESLPGFAFHQTDRDVTAVQKAICADGRCSNASRSRDFDLLGHRYSLLSSIGTAGLNNVACYLPARNAEEFEKLPKEEITFVKHWYDWADSNVALLRNTKVLPGLSVPSFGALDGVSMVDEEGRNGAIFIYNPTSRPLAYSAPFNESLGVQCGTTNLHLKVRLAGSSERHAKAHDIDLVPCGHSLNVTVPPTTAMVLFLSEWHKAAGALTLLGAPFVGDGHFDLTTGVLSLSGVVGEPGTSAILRAHVAHPSAVTSVVLNGEKIAFRLEEHRGLQMVSMRGKWVGTSFGRNPELCGDGAGAMVNGDWTCKFTVPSRVISQLKARNASFPLEYDLRTNSTNDANTAWMAPGRLLMWVKYRNADPKLNVSGSIDGHQMLWRKAYNTIVANPHRFIGYFADVTPLVQADKPQTLTLQLPQTGGWLIRTGALSQRSVTVAEKTGPVNEAKAACKDNAACAGVTFRKPQGATTCAEVKEDAKVHAYLKGDSSGNADKAWCTEVLGPTLVGVFFENVEAEAMTSEWRGE